ncbi:hypothetical protein R0P26_003779 [Escherichia coli O5]|nr:hypothetical protein [Escherichia coli O5]
MGSVTKKPSPVVIIKKKRRILSHQDDAVQAVPDDIKPAPVMEFKTDSLPPEIPATVAGFPEQQKKTGRKKKKKKKNNRWNHEFIRHSLDCVKKTFPQLRAEEGGYHAFKIGISKDVMAFISASPECGLTVKEWSCAVRMITGGYKYLQRISVAGTPRYGLDGKVHGTVTEEEALYAQAKLEKHTQRYNARMKETGDARCNQSSTNCHTGQQFEGRLHS